MRSIFEFGKNRKLTTAIICLEKYASYDFFLKNKKKRI